ncbi:MAG: HlyD family type I secretion periplasmic adaptor subunit [Rhodospirillales bacterium]
MNTTSVTNMGSPGEGRLRVKRGGRQTRFLAQSVILEEAGHSGLIRFSMFLICAAVAGFIGWAGVTSVKQTAAASGEVTPAGDIQMVQHLEGGIVREISVKDGDLVESGQVLIRLNPAKAEAERDQIRARLAGLKLQAERLRALGGGGAPDFTVAGPGYEAMAEDQRDIYKSAGAALENSRTVMQRQAAQRENELEALEEERENLLTNLGFLEEQVGVQESLMEEGLTSKIIYLDVQRQANEAEGALVRLAGERTQTLGELREARSRMAALDSDARAESLNEMGQVTAEMAQVRKALDSLEERAGRLEIRAPVRGVVKGMLIKTVGGVIAPGGAVMDIVPADAEMIVEARISTRDIGHVKIGDPVSVKVTAFDFARYGGIEGELRGVSASTFTDEETGEPYYRGSIALARGYVGDDPKRNRVLPGMTVQADINTGEKTLLEYLINPVVKTVSAGFRER